MRAVAFFMEMAALAYCSAQVTVSSMTPSWPLSGPPIIDQDCFFSMLPP
ncbi:hypothetical protein ACEF06_18650 [Brevibacillus agri]|nr:MULTISPECIES: hypothetical protein [Brevibacillus]QHZ55141.1 hypothetical protein M655_005410 [Brevibacillus sp. NSP2.1]